MIKAIQTEDNILLVQTITLIFMNLISNRLYNVFKINTTYLSHILGYLVIELDTNIV